MSLYKKGKCIHGEKCEFWHPQKCNKFPKCPLGSKCSYYHPIGEKNVTPAQSRENSPAKADGNVVPKPKNKAKAKAKAGANAAIGETQG